MSVAFLYGYKVCPDQSFTGDRVQQTIESLGCLTSISETCINVVAGLLDGSVPTKRQAAQIAYAATIISGLANELSEHLENEVAK